MKKKLLALCLILVMLMSIGCESSSKEIAYNTNQINVSDTNTETSISDTNAIKDSTQADLRDNKTIEEIINDAKEIVIKKNIISLRTTYSIFIDNEQIGTITGKFVNMTGDIFTFQDNDGNVIGKEKQIKRWGVKLNRLAQVYDKNDKTIGYIGEDVIKDLFKISTQFHFYDKDKNEIGYTKKQIISVLDKVNILDLNNEVVAEINQKFSISSMYTIKINDNNSIPVSQLIYFTCIYDAIQSATD